MSDPIQQITNLLKQHSFRLARQDRHYVYKNPDGRVHVMPVSPSDHRWAKNNLAELKRTLASPPVPEVLVISQFEKEQAALVIKPRGKDPGPGHTKQKRNGNGTGIHMVPEKKPVIPPEVRERHRQHQKIEALQQKALQSWDSEVQKAKQEFIGLVVSKVESFINTAVEDQQFERDRQELLARYRYYADTRLKKDVELWHRLFGKHDLQVNSKEERLANAEMSKASSVLRSISDIDMSNPARFQDMNDEVSKCSKCVKHQHEGYDDFQLCVEHMYKKYRRIAWNIDQYTERPTIPTKEEFVAWATDIFQDAMKNEEFWKSQEEVFRGRVLYRFIFKKLKLIVDSLLRTRPKMAEAA